MRGRKYKKSYGKRKSSSRRGRSRNRTKRLSRSPGRCGYRL